MTNQQNLSELIINLVQEGKLDDASIIIKEACNQLTDKRILKLVNNLTK